MNMFSNANSQFLSLVKHDGHPKEFWETWLRAIGELCDASNSFLFAEENSKWHVLYRWEKSLILDYESMTDVLNAVANTQSGKFYEAVIESTGEYILSTRITFDASKETFNSAPVLVLVYPDSKSLELLSIKKMLKLAVTLPVQYELNREYQFGQLKLSKLFEIISFIIRFSNESHFDKACILLCNDIATKYRCERVTLGWLEKSYVRIKAVSHVEVFDKSMATSQQLETVMEEAFDQDTAIAWPNMEGESLILKNHQQYARQQGVGNILSLPIRVTEQPEAVLTLERSNTEFVAGEIWELNLVTEAASSKLADLYEKKKWFGSRLILKLKKGLGHFWGYEHSLAKLIALLVSVLLVLLITVEWPYRVEGKFTLKSENIVFMPAPFDGYLKETFVDIGDEVHKDQVLAELETSELVLKQAMESADLFRYSNEIIKAQGKGKLADMQIAQARKDQAEARLQLINFQLENAKLRSRMNGILVEGELKKNLGAPLRKGDLLFKIADIENTFVEIEVPEEQIFEIKKGSTGEIAFVGRPDIHFAIKIVRISPAATTIDGKNVFLVKANYNNNAEPWWRPGMSGVAKIDVGDKSLLWLFTHRTVRFLQQAFWL